MSKSSTIDALFDEAYELFRESQRPKIVADTALFAPVMNNQGNEETTLSQAGWDTTLSDDWNQYAADQVEKGKEVEVRFGWFQGRFVPGVPKGWFYNLLSTFQKYAPSVKPVKSTTLIKDDVRVTETGSKKIAERKRVEYSNDDEVFGIRFSVAKEERLQTVPTDTTGNRQGDNTKVWFQRNRLRWSYPIGGRRFDLTIVLPSGEAPKPVFEVEIEYTSPNGISVYRDVKITLSHMQRLSMTNALVQHDIKAIIGNYNMLFTTSTEAWVQNIFDKTENKPQSFRWANVFYGGAYYITPKLDGVRKRLFFDRNGVFAIQPGTNECTMISLASDQDIGTVVDTEFYDGEYYPFDILAYRGRSLLTDTFSTRLTLLKDVYYNMFNTSKPFFGTGDFFADFAAAKEWADQHQEVRLDGFIAQSDEAVYAGTKTMKIKPLDELTVDLETRVDERKQVRLYSTNARGPFEVNFNPKNEDNLRSEMGRYTVKNLRLPETIQSGSIVEYRFTNKDPFVRFKQVRVDKIAPNFIKTVNSTYHDFFIDPTSFDDLLDETLVPWRKWATSCKRNLIQQHVPSGARVLDIGIGRGAVLKEEAEKAQTVYGIDPDAGNLKELGGRMENRDFMSRVELANIKGQDTTAVRKFIGSPVDVVLSMFSLSFFYKSEDDLNALVDTIAQSCRQGGKFIVMFMDGHEVAKKMSEGAYENDIVSITGSEDADSFGSKIKIDLPQEPDPIFRNQKEWLASFGVLTSKLRARGFTVLDSVLMNKDAVLPPLNLEFAAMNRIAIFEKSGKRMGGEKEYEEGFKIETLPVGQDLTLDDRWIRHGIEWDQKSFARSFLYTIGKDSYEADPDAAILDLANNMAKNCSRQVFAGLEDGRVQKRMAFDLLYSDKVIVTEKLAVKAALKEYRQRCLDVTVGHEACGVLNVIYPGRKIVIIDEEGNELKRYGTGKRTSYIQKIGNYAYSPLSKAEGYVHLEPAVREPEEVVYEKVERGAPAPWNVFKDRGIAEEDRERVANRKVAEAYLKKERDIADREIKRQMAREQGRSFSSSGSSFVAPEPVVPKSGSRKGAATKEAATTKNWGDSSFDASGFAGELEQEMFGEDEE